MIFKWITPQVDSVILLEREELRNVFAIRATGRMFQDLSYSLPIWQADSFDLHDVITRGDPTRFDPLGFEMQFLNIFDCLTSDPYMAESIACKSKWSF